MKKEYKKAVFIELGIIFLALLIFIGIQQGWIIKFIPPCFVYEHLGILCPSCGETRCVIEIVHGNFKDAFFYHPIFFLTGVYLLIANLVYLINVGKKKKIATWIYPKEKFWIAFIIVLLAFTVIRNI